MNSIAVFCGSSIGASDAYREGAIQLGKELAKRQITLIYGGASVGIMATVADTVLQEGGKVIGVIPTLLEAREIAHQQLTELIVVNTMHERKSKMMELADGFIALPGGPGTLEEFFEVFTWNQIGLIQKPCAIFNIEQYFDLLISFFDHMQQEQFLKAQFREALIVDADAVALLDKCQSFVPPAIKTYELSK
ncbi:TIGR00730 family Rossman fold protein [Lysinibacillus sp. FSL M8-0216]|uniref:LOG family protein n=1 Tax=Lysinibacillus TaxID=400634 RepID=UPI000D3C14B5|nr:MULTISPECIES: TIGR00730 family Rossman fold protein [Lysinibacillus]MCG7435874.1 TIGR00730 family Rossman fold protein [Lysinibacillus fusiformis]MED4670986.1 TIGR00730 family Rossman fold protein [Lysinibacillus fusiformis]QAS55528.1 TIGR00730 family Rossman fold protein [Lysinibacillus sphaericus]RDV33748.1 TIGR00730 family Rossman fold protein [Lysinibacillus fusiformis]GED65717.1 cytokinin riboside 5'-monophosphate phosphoribohydrolase [Lysinibacillus fusiformis]